MCVLYELYNAYYHANNKSTAGSGAILDPDLQQAADLQGGHRRMLPACRSSPASSTTGEVMSGHIDHAIRFTAQTTNTAYIWPALDQAGSVTNANYPPMGARFRLSAPASTCPRQTARNHVRR